MLLYEFLVLAEYWVAPPLLGIRNYAGLWSDVGVVLFGVFVATLAVFVLWPLRIPLGRALSTRGPRLAFHSVWIGSLVAALFLTNTFQLSRATLAGAPVQLGATTVYSPFGAWPSLTIYLPRIGLFGTLDAELLTVLGLLAVLGSATLRLFAARATSECPRPIDRPWRSRIASAMVWSPFGLITGCPACAPAYLALVGLVAPGAPAGLALVPLVPWVGLAGLLYLGSFALVLYLLRRATEPDPIPSRSDGG
ncbi:MAG TPA: hypothetical protein VGV64_03445 [Thermoplasmata archaeon]|nr:hypothetical protein [Thermoplasmata archaeon]